MGISRRDYERLSSETKSQAVVLLEEIKALLRPRFSLRFLGLDGRWKDLNPPRFLTLSEDHYERLIRGSRGVSSRYKRDLLDKITELFMKPSKESGLEKWLENSHG